jgi:RNA polymerase sigma factor (sigma-70 family)
MRKSQAIHTSHEELIVQRYEWLLRWALEFSNGDRHQAEDLVHEVFVHFTLDRPDLAAVTQNLEGYLYTMLRNMHISGIRRTVRQQNAYLSLAQLNGPEPESLEDELRAAEERELDVHDRLRRICEYACIRKETSKAGSVLILRFFLGYYPAEIAEILRVSRGAVNEWLRTARAEARMYLRDPDSLAFIAKVSSRKPSFNKTELVAEDLIRELHSAIFSSQGQGCLTRNQYQDLYRDSEERQIVSSVLDHLVSCRQCLDSVNDLLGLPPLASRYPIKTLSRDTRPEGKSGGGQSGGGAGGASSGDGLLARSRRRLKKVIEHRPQTLRVAVNGFVVGSQRLGLRSNELVISVNIEETIGFVEIFSEQDVRMLFSTIAPPPEGSIDHRKRIALSDGRSLELSLSFSEPWPILRVVYFDPGLQENEAQLPEAQTPAESRVVEDSNDSGVSGSGPVNSKTRQLRALLSDWTFWLRPGFVAPVLALLAFALAFILWRTPQPAISVATLLQRSVVAEQADAIKTDQVLHRTIDLEERRADGGDLIARRRLEIWQSAAKGIKALRIYDDKGQLIAGEWTGSDGTRTLYHHQTKPESREKGTAESPETALLNLENISRLDLSSRQFSSLTPASSDPGSLIVSEQPTAYLISYDGGGARLQGVVKATLTLSRTDLHAVAQTLFVKRGDEVREYRFSEESLERHTPDAVTPSVFEPEPELLSLAQPGISVPNRNALTAVPGPRPSTVTASAELEVEVLRLLSQAGADLGEQVSVTRAPDGPVVVEGIVDTNDRKAEILRSLQSLSTNPAVRVEVTTVAEALQRRRAPATGESSSTTVERVEAATVAIPVDADLRRYLTSRGTPANQIDEEISRLARRTMGQSLNVLQHAWALKRLAARFSTEDLRTLSPEARSKWLSMIRQHAQILEHGLASLRGDISAIFPEVSSVEAGATAIGPSDQDLNQAIMQLFDLCSAEEQAVRSAFAMAPTSSSAAAVRSPQFWISMRTAERLAAGIGRR